jgi:hypothetical protein
MEPLAPFYADLAFLSIAGNPSSDRCACRSPALKPTNSHETHFARWLTRLPAMA